LTDTLETFPPRIHVIFAPVANIGVVFRRGPSKQVATFLWDRSKDTFTIGQWLKGRIYERRADVSPDGTHMIYFAMNGKWDSETRGSWTAISKAPFLKAVDLYSKGDCWEGGGLFLTSNRYWLNDRHFNEKYTLKKDSKLACDRQARPEHQFGSECTGVYYPRLLRSGWKLMERAQQGKWHSKTVFEKPLSNGWVLRKIAHEQVDAPRGKGCYWDEHEVENLETGASIRLPDWEWAEWDQGTLVWAQLGKIYRGRFKGKRQLGEAKLLHNFTDYSFEPIVAPY